MGLKLKLGQVSRAEFAGAMTKLGRVSGLPAKDVYALARTIRELNAASEDFGKAHKGLIRKWGAAKFAESPESKVQGPKSEDGDRGDSVPTEPIGWEVARGSENWAAFEKEYRELAEMEVEIFLDHKLALPEGVTELTAFEVLELELIIQSPSGNSQ